jgi:hypothetical protein
MRSFDLKTGHVSAQDLDIGLKNASTLQRAKVLRSFLFNDYARP